MRIWLGDGTLTGRFLLCTLGFIAAASCHLGSDRRIDLADAVEIYVRSALQLAQHDAQLVQDWRGPQAWRPGPRGPVAATAAAVDRLERDLEHRVHPRTYDGDVIGVRQDRGFDSWHYLLWQSRALKLASRRLLGETTTFADELRALFGHIPVPADAPVPAEALAALNRLLPGDMPLAGRVAAYRSRLAIPDERRLEVFTAALGACRRATQAATRLLPDDESVEVAFVSGMGWDGFARYLGNRRSRIEINTDTPLDVARALRLACHEGYPGHHTQHLLRDLDGAGIHAAYDLSPAFGPHYVIAEGAAEAAADLVMTAADRERVYRDILLPAAGLPPGEAPRMARIDELVAQTARATTPIVRDYLDGRLTAAAAAERLSHDALIPSPDRFLAFVDRVRTRAVVYSEGRLVVRGYLESRGLRDGLWRLFVSRPFALQ
jgi:hypothetical protein